MNHFNKGCSKSLPGLHQVPHDPRQRPHDGDPPTGSGALQVIIPTCLVCPVYLNLLFQFDHERSRLPGRSLLRHREGLSTPSEEDQGSLQQSSFYSELIRPVNISPMLYLVKSVYQVVWLQHDALLHQLLHDGGLLRGRDVQHAQPGPGPSQCEVAMFLPVLETLK